MNEIPKVTGYFKSFDETPIYYEVRGSGPPLVLAYGIGCLINHWHHQLNYFSQSYQTIVFDYRGHHKSAVPISQENLTIDSLAQDLLLLLKHLGIAKASLWAHSFGALVLLRAFDRDPSYCQNIVLINGFATNPIKDMFGNGVINSAFEIFKKGYERFPDTTRFMWQSAVDNPLSIRLAAFLGGFNLNLTSLKDIEVYVRGVASLPLDVFITFFDQMMSYDAQPVLNRIQVPTLIISGRQDSVTPRKYQELLHRSIRGSQFLEIPYGSHCVQLDLPEFINLRIEKFLREAHTFS